ncbi:MAG: hypothetical protein AB7W16_00500 [Candidatus Obscuribacterales bacterium]
MSSDNTAVKPRKKTTGFASRLLHKELNERDRKPSLEFIRPSFLSSVETQAQSSQEKVLADKS